MRSVAVKRQAVRAGEFREQLRHQTVCNRDLGREQLAKPIDRDPRLVPPEGAAEAGIVDLLGGRKRVPHVGVSLVITPSCAPPTRTGNRLWRKRVTKSSDSAPTRTPGRRRSAAARTSRSSTVLGLRNSRTSDTSDASARSEAASGSAAGVCCPACAGATTSALAAAERSSPLSAPRGPTSAAAIRRTHGSSSHPPPPPRWAERSIKWQHAPAWRSSQRRLRLHALPRARAGHRFGPVPAAPCWSSARRR